MKAPERRKGYYTVYVYDPNLAGNGGYVSKLGLGGILGYNEATGQEWKLYHRQRPADEAKDAQQAVWSETPVLITPPTPNRLRCRSRWYNRPLRPSRSNSHCFRPSRPRAAHYRAARSGAVQDQQTMKKRR
ncbi:MAG: hypothetical protein HC828_01475 [Blastochloris sp.]|nr:hypothetical protein [Blastochloris sp.]